MSRTTKTASVNEPSIAPLTDISTPLRKIQLAREKYEEEVKAQKGSLLDSFQRQLVSLTETYKTLTIDASVPHNEIANLPSLSEFVRPFTASRSMSMSTAPKAGNGKRVSSSELDAAILKVIGNGEKTHAEIKASEEVAGLYKAIGKEPGNQYVKLDNLIKAKVLTQNGKGKEAKYSVAKK